MTNFNHPLNFKWISQHEFAMAFQNPSADDQRAATSGATAKREQSGQIHFYDLRTPGRVANSSPIISDCFYGLQVDKVNKSRANSNGT